MKEEDFIEYQDKIFLVVIFLLTSRLELLKQFNDPENKSLWGSWSFNGIFQIFYQSLLDSFIVTLSWVLAAKEQRSLVWYLNQVRTHSKKIQKDEIDSQLDRIKAEEPTINKIKSIRDKWIAHRDASPFNDPEKFLTANQINFNDLERLVNLVKEIIREHYGAFQGGDIDFDLPGTKINDLTRCLNERQLLMDFFINIKDVRSEKCFEVVLEAKQKLSRDMGWI